MDIIDKEQWLKHRTDQLFLKEKNAMSTNKIISIILLVAGGLAVAYGGFSFISDTHQMNIGSMHMAFNEHRYVAIPLWAGIGAIVAGGLLLAFGKRV